MSSFVQDYLDMWLFTGQAFMLLIAASIIRKILKTLGSSVVNTLVNISLIIPTFLLSIPFFALNVFLLFAVIVFLIGFIPYQVLMLIL